MIVDFGNGRKYIIGWKHDRLDFDHRCSHQTMCFIKPWTPRPEDPKNAPKVEAIATGTACCSLKDPYNKNTGRKTSLQRAFKAATNIFTKEERKEIWEMYKNRKPVPSYV